MHKVFIGTMRSHEGEFDLCMTAIKNQTGVFLDHLLIEGMREYEAHERLYRTWEENKSSFDAFIKIDADMVLKDETVIERCIKELHEAMSKGYTSIQCPLYDYFLEGMVYGLNCYSTKVVFEKPSNRIFCDRSTKNNKTWVIRSPDQTKNNLYPAGSHCSNPTDHQSFMWGYHRGSKANHDIYRQLMNSIEKRGTRQKHLALCGFKAGFERRSELSYNDPEFMEFFLSRTKLL